MITVLPTKFQIHFKFSLGLHRRGRPVCRSGGDKIVNLNLTFLQFQFGSEKQIQILLMATGLHWKWFGDTANNANGGKYYFYIFIFWQRLWRPRPAPAPDIFMASMSTDDTWPEILSVITVMSHLMGNCQDLTKPNSSLASMNVLCELLVLWKLSPHLFIYAARYWWTQRLKVVFYH